MTNLVSLVELAGFPPWIPLMTDTIHTLGWLLLVALVTVPALALAGSAIREALSKPSSATGRPPQRPAARLCPSGAA
jgi:hypothetical protein